MKAVKIIALVLIGLPIALFLVVLLLGIIAWIVPFATIGFLGMKFFSWRLESRRLKLKVQLKTTEYENTKLSFT